MFHAKSLGLQKEGQWGASIVHDDTEPAAREGKLWANSKDHELGMCVSINTSDLD